MDPDDAMLVDLGPVVRFGEGLFWSARMLDFKGWGAWSVEMLGGPQGHARDVLEFAETNGIGGEA